MNLWRRINIPETHLTPGHLADEANGYANALASGRWHQKQVGYVFIERSIMQLDGESYDGGVFVEPVTTETTISFAARKEVIDGSWNYKTTSQFQLSSVTAQYIGIDEVPGRILDKIFEDASEEDHPLNGITIEDIDEDDVFEVKRGLSSEYMIDDSGDISSYSLSHEYMFDEDVVHRTAYSSNNQSRALVPVRLAQGLPLEHHPMNLTVLNESVLEKEIMSIDDVIGLIVSSELIDSEATLAGLPKKEHIRRAMRMLKLLQS